MKQLLSPKQVATSIGVSESSLKRWCDQGLIRSSKTPGGHRRLRVGDVVQFLRETHRPLVQAEAIGLPAEVRGERPLEHDSSAGLREALASGSESECRRHLLDFYVAGTSIVQLCEQVVAPAMHEIGDLWTCGSVEVYQERRACEMVNRVLNEVRSLLPSPPQGAPVALGGTPPDDNYRLATLMVEMSLIEAGWRAMSLGSDLPYTTLRAAASENRPQLFWLSLTSNSAGEDLASNLGAFRRALPPSVKLVVGGRALDEAGIEALPGIQVCRGLQSMVDFANSLRSGGPAQA